MPALAIGHPLDWSSPIDNTSGGIMKLGIDLEKLKQSQDQSNKIDQDSEMQQEEENN